MKITSANPDLTTDTGKSNLSAHLKSDWKREIGLHFAVLGFYSLLMLVLAWQPIMGLAVGTPGDFEVDRNQNLWNQWWFRRSLLVTGTNPYNTDFLFYPYGAKLYLHTFSPYILGLGLPLQLLFGIVPAFNILALLSFPLGGWAAWWLARYLTGSGWAALSAGLIYSFSAYHWVELRQNQIDLLNIQWLPLFILFLIKLDRANTRRDIIVNGLLTAFFFFLTLTVALYYALWLIQFAALYWFWRLIAIIWQNRTKKENPLRAIVGLTGKIGAALAGGLLPFSPIIYATVRETTVNKDVYAPLVNDATNQIHSTDLLHLFLPPQHQPWWGGAASFWSNIGLRPVAGETLPLNDWGAVLSYTTLALAVVALLWARRNPPKFLADTSFWAFNAVFWTILSLGPTLRINGQNTDIPLPYRLLNLLPFFGIGRFPERYILLTQLALGILAAGVLAHWLFRPAAKIGARSFALLGVFMTLFLVEQFVGFLAPPKPIVQPEFTKAIAADSLKPGAIFEFPVTKHSNPDSPRMLYQIYHQRPIMGGYISRELRDPHRVANQHPLFDWFDTRREALEGDIVPQKTPGEMLTLLNRANVTYVVVYENDPEWRNPSLKPIAQRLINYAELSAVFSDTFAAVYRVPAVSLAPTKPILTLGSGWLPRETLLDGRGYQRWLNANATDSNLIVVAPDQASGYNLEIAASPPPGIAERRLYVYLNGELIGKKVVTGERLIVENLPLRPGENVISLRPDPTEGYFIPAERGADLRDTRKLQIAVLSLQVKKPGEQ
jgi:hypothetical protein